MADLQDGFSNLSPLPWSSVPSDLPKFLQSSFSSVETLLNSIPPPPPLSNDAQTSKDYPASARDTVVSKPPKISLDERYASLQKLWGKPLKFSQKENPLNVAVYKTAAHDRHGAWFARRSVHRGLPFERWKAATRNEFLESLKRKRDTEWAPGKGAVRGIAADRRIETKEVEGAGRAEVWQLSAKFGPIAPREFCVLNLMSDNALGEESSINGKIPRHFAVISRPSEHDDFVDRDGMVRAFYESTEIFREVIPEDGSDDNEDHLIEWIMVTRSDPGGGIPKFMVERGTPGSIVADVAKFIDWACTIQDEDENETASDKDAVIEEVQRKASRPDAFAEVNPMAGKNTVDSDQPGADGKEEQTGFLSSVSNAVGNTMSSYLPYFQGDQSHAKGPADADDVSDTSTSSSDYESVVEYSPEDSGTASLQMQNTNASESSLSPATGLTQPFPDLDESVKPRNQNEKNLLKLRQRRAELEEKHAQALSRADQQLQSQSQKSEEDAAKAAEKYSRERRKHAESHAKEISKLQARQIKEAAKAEEKRLKAQGKSELVRVKRERDGFKERLHVVERENEILRTQVESLQRENTALVARLGSTEAGKLAVQRVQYEVGKTRSMSTGSAKSSRSGGRAKELGEEDTRARSSSIKSQKEK